MFREYRVPSAIHIFIPRRNISYSLSVMHPASISGLQIRATLLLLFLQNSYRKPVWHCSAISSINATCYLKASGQQKYIIMLFPIERGGQMCIKMTSFAEQHTSETYFSFLRRECGQILPKLDKLVSKLPLFKRPSWKRCSNFGAIRVLTNSKLKRKKNSSRIARLFYDGIVFERNQIFSAQIVGPGKETLSTEISVQKAGSN